MLNNNHDFVEPENILNRMRQISASHMIVAYRAKMTNYELMVCQEISAVSKIPLMDVLEKMAAFKQTSEYLLYKKDFLFF